MPGCKQPGLEYQLWETEAKNFSCVSLVNATFLGEASRPTKRVTFYILYLIFDI